MAILRSIILSISLIVFPGMDSVFAKDGAAKALVVKGDVSIVTPDGKLSKLEKMSWIPEGTTVKTGEKSFARLVFVDKSTINVAAKSEMKIQKFDGKEAGVVDLAFGRIRSKVIKHSEQTDKTKLYIKTKTAAMGIRGTDFQVIHNAGKNLTNLVTFTGEVRFAKFEGGSDVSRDLLEQRISGPGAVPVRQGQMSVVSEKTDKASAPVRINPIQLDAMAKNENMEEGQGKAASKGQVKAKVLVAPGVIEQNAGGVDQVLEVMTENVEGSESVLGDAIGDAPAEGAVTEGAAVTDDGVLEGGYVNVETGEYMEPPEDAPVDPNTGMALMTDVTVDMETGELVAPPEQTEVIATTDDLTREPTSTDEVVIIDTVDPAQQTTLDSTLTDSFLRDLARDDVQGTSTRLQINVNVQ